MKSYQLILAEHQILETERLVLRPVTLEDAADMYEYASDEETTTYVFDKHKTIEDTRENLATYFLSKPLGTYGIILKDQQKMIGTIDIRIDEANRKAELGYTLNRAFWGQGLTTEAGQKMLWLAFDKLCLNRVEAKHDERNPASGRVMAKLGMVKEAVLRNDAILKGEVTTTVICGITKEDYFNSQEQ
ncbi:GNAT family N-acetyltransferase [Vagococcus sp. BWB3-3]|uniref:GNAT family N-acetyltransferase n=1 Tax=Vagococcus allomyrinae TaxID=2794353 RepID=A0A940P2S0_9ENTE|nr:GNAT family N-acetyltransferase [Vagococcus allomyrinae]MBP1039980.1 GNAT family N-acetyltransferase [Vagococcus allomyrinae]